MSGCWNFLRFLFLTGRAGIGLYARCNAGWFGSHLAVIPNMVCHWDHFCFSLTAVVTSIGLYSSVLTGGFGSHFPFIPVVCFLGSRFSGGEFFPSVRTICITCVALFFAGGFSAADEPDGSAKFIVNILLNEKVRAAIDHFIERGGLIIGICNGFQALVKSGLLPYGNFEDASSTSPTLFYNDANQHVAKMVETRIANTNSPWLAGVEVGDIHAIPVSHGEGKFVVTAEEFAELRDNGQIFTQYVDFEGKPSMDSKYNPNGSVNAIEGITSKNGQIIGKMGHSERFEDGLFQNIPGNKDQHLFASAVKYFTGK